MSRLILSLLLVFAMGSSAQAGNMYGGVSGGATFVPDMTNKQNRKNINEVRIKFVAPEELKLGLQALANDRNIALSALLRLIATEYIKRYQSP